MVKSELIEAVNRLNLDPKDYIVIGSGTLCALGLREANDVDMCVSPSVFEEFESKGWEKKELPGDTSYYLTDDIYEIGMDWDSTNSQPNLDDLKKTEMVIDGVPFVGLERLRAWKERRGKPKDLTDIQLIDKYLSKQE